MHRMNHESRLREAKRTARMLGKRTERVGRRTTIYQVDLSGPKSPFQKPRWGLTIAKAGSVTCSVKEPACTKDRLLKVTMPFENVCSRVPLMATPPVVPEASSAPGASGTAHRNYGSPGIPVTAIFA